MYWKFKASIANAVSLLPERISYSTYYWIQRRFGALRRLDPTSRLSAGIEIVKRIKDAGLDPAGKVFFEVGTGRVAVTPLAFWLMGARKTITVDLNPYLKEELVRESVEYISRNHAELVDLFGPLLDEHRLSSLLSFARGDWGLDDFLELCAIEYIAPGDAANTSLEPQSVDFHTSYTVFEHITKEVLAAILKEGVRILKRDGLALHRIDYSDHFSHSDPNISAINFLRFSDQEWARYAGNRFMYMNRLRHDTFVRLFSSLKYRIIFEETDFDRQAFELLRSGAFALDEQFLKSSPDLLSTTASWIVGQPAL